LTVVLVAAAGAIAFGLFRLSRQESQTISPKQLESVVLTQQMKMARLTTTGKASAAAISPNGEFVVHVVDDGKQQSLWLRQVSTSSNVQIIPPAEVTYFGLTFSPGGENLYYIFWDRKSYYLLYQMPMLGGAAKRLTQDIDSNVTFSPDGRQYAFLRGYPTQGNLNCWWRMPTVRQSGPSLLTDWSQDLLVTQPGRPTARSLPILWKTPTPMVISRLCLQRRWRVDQRSRLARSGGRT
jgi:hypothetical protein